MIGYWHNTVVCPSVCLLHCALWQYYTSYSESKVGGTILCMGVKLVGWSSALPPLLFP